MKESFKKKELLMKKDKNKKDIRFTGKFLQTGCFFLKNSAFAERSAC